MTEVRSAEADRSRRQLPVTVIIPTYNRESTLEATLHSVESQEEYRVTKMLVVDDQSSDGSADLAERLGYEVIRLAENGGAAAARNRGIDRVDTEWICFLDSDDQWRARMLATLWPHTPGNAIVSGAALLTVEGRVVTVMGAEGTGQRLNGPVDILNPDNPIMTSTTLVRTDLVKRVGGFDTRWRYSEDLELWLKVLEHGTGWCDATPTLDYHRSASSKSLNPGVEAARVGIVYSFRDRPWWSDAVAQRAVGIIYWESMSGAIRARDLGRAVHYARRLLRSGPRLHGAIAGIGRRRRLRRQLAGSVRT